MLTAAVSKVKAELSDFLRKVKGGEELLITERGRPVARLIPYRAGVEEDGRLRRLEREGIVRVGRTAFPEELLARGPRVQARESVVRALQQEREESL